MNCSHYRLGLNISEFLQLTENRCVFLRLGIFCLVSARSCLAVAGGHGVLERQRSHNWPGRLCEGVSHVVTPSSRVILPIKTTSYFPKTHYSLAQTWLAVPELHRLHFRNNTAITAYSWQIAPGQANTLIGENSILSRRRSH